nr:lymphotoxin-alpha [Meriones unguiculatus]
MPAPGRLPLSRVLGAPAALLLGLLLALPLATQGLSSAGTARRPPHKQPALLKPAAHLVGYPGQQSSLLWRATTDRAFLRHGFSLSNNSLLVPAGGLYFVYSQVLFRGAGRPPGAAPVYLAHEVRLLSAQYPSHVPLLSAQKSVPPGLRGPWVRSLYQGAVFLLSRGDRLSTRTDGAARLHFSPSSVFFGAFAL